MKIFFNIQCDCEATQESVSNPQLGKNSIHGLGDIYTETGMKGTFVVIPSDIKVHSLIYKYLEKQGHEIGLHVHPKQQGYSEFLGVHSYEDQVKILTEGIDIFEQCMGKKPECFTPGYASANDYTFTALETVGLKHGFVSMPTRTLSQCASVWGNSPLDAHYPHRYNRCLTGDVDFVDVPVTIDPDSRMWGGLHPLDLRVELVDAKNHYYTIEKAVKRLIAADTAIPVKYIKVLTHNIFDYSDKTDFRRKTLFGIIQASRKIFKQYKCELVPCTTAEIAVAYRKAVPLPKNGVKLELDTRGRQKDVGHTGV